MTKPRWLNYSNHALRFEFGMLKMCAASRAPGPASLIA
jgi:hypothetical protein